MQVTLHPYRAPAAWARGELRALNPLGFVATAAAVRGPLKVLVFGWSGGLVVELIRWAASYVAMIVFGLVCHAVSCGGFGRTLAIRFDRGELAPAAHAAPYGGPH
jgi:hypothetical protein